MNYQTHITKKRLSWIEVARKNLLHLLGDDLIHPIFRVQPTVDPLKFFLIIKFTTPLPKNFYPNFRVYLRELAKKEDCDLPLINISEKGIMAEVLTKYRHRRDNGTDSRIR